MSHYLITLTILLGCLTTDLAAQQIVAEKIPIVIITDLYHPYQDPGDNLDLINGYALPEVNLLGVIIDGTDAFRKEIADHPTLWLDPRGPREVGIIPIEQLNYIFKRAIPYSVGPLEMMASENDKMESLSGFENGVDHLLSILQESEQPIEIISFGSARVVAVAYNRDPELLRSKIARIHLSAGTASPNYELGCDVGANMIPGGEWNVALDVYAFTRLMRSSLPIALYPCAGRDGGFVMDKHNTYWRMGEMNFLREMAPQLQCYIDFAFSRQLRHDYLRAMDQGAPYTIGKSEVKSYFHLWESLIWLEVAGLHIVTRNDNDFELIKKSDVKSEDQVVESVLRPCSITVRDDGRFTFDYTQKSNISIYYRPDIEKTQQALNIVIPRLFASYMK